MTGNLHRDNEFAKLCGHLPNRLHGIWMNPAMKQYKLAGLDKEHIHLRVRSNIPVRIDNSDVQDCVMVHKESWTLCKTHDYHNKGKIGGVFEGTIKVQQWMTDKTGHFLLVPNAPHHVEIETKCQLAMVQETNPQNFID
ncbi:hypothetical protein RFI_38452 [Reticulomyxa filosa]|uniref:Uncharacterized protein n=1 Tax=Reticulomyxa filosa TaxID=46433 RepID=X6LCF3_RETFI|nr:hypothetical protein RFI_38452 [Reticulomyxa filosa]|eukprot:ETN99035.1 hypothetical protein RFI_38452 [Reticulomyxa filosa]